MTTEQIHASLDKMLADPKSRNFLNHLVKAYFPVSNVKKVETKPTGLFKCVITREELFCTDDIIVGMQSEDAKKAFVESLKAMLTEVNGKLSYVESIIGAKKLGVTGKDTNTFMSYPAHVEFFAWLKKKILEKDKHINWLVSTIRHNAKTNHHKNHDTPPIKEATYTLGDLGVLQKLKESLKTEEKQ